MMRQSVFLRILDLCRSRSDVLSAIGGNVIVNIKDSRVAVNADMARHIMI